MNNGYKYRNVKPGDQIAYRYKPAGYFNEREELDVRVVTEVLDGGAAFRVEGGYVVPCNKVDFDLPANESGVASPESGVAGDDDDEWEGAQRQHPVLGLKARNRAAGYGWCGR